MDTIKDYIQIQLYCSFTNTYIYAHKTLTMEDQYSLKVNDQFDFSINEKDSEQLDVQQKSENSFHLIHENKSVDVKIISTDFINRKYTVSVNSNHYKVEIGTPLDALIDAMGLARGAITAINDIKAPMPGLILDVSVKPGDVVNEGDYLLVLEAMKMENALTAPRDGVVKAVSVNKGDTVDKGQLLIEME